MAVRRISDDVDTIDDKQPSPRLPWELIFRIVECALEPLATHGDFDLIRLPDFALTHAIWAEVKRLVSQLEVLVDRLRLQNHETVTLRAPLWNYPALVKLDLHVYMPDRGTNVHARLLEQALSQIGQRCPRLQTLRVAFRVRYMRNKNPSDAAKRRQLINLGPMVRIAMNCTLMPASVTGRWVKLVEEGRVYRHGDEWRAKPRPLEQVVTMIWLIRGWWLPVTRPNTGD